MALALSRGPGCLEAHQEIRAGASEGTIIQRESTLPVIVHRLSLSTVAAIVSALTKRCIIDESAGMTCGAQLGANGRIRVRHIAVAGLEYFEELARAPLPKLSDKAGDELIRHLSRELLTGELLIKVTLAPQPAEFRTVGLNHHLGCGVETRIQPHTIIPGAPDTLVQLAREKRFQTIFGLQASDAIVNAFVWPNQIALDALGTGRSTLGIDDVDNALTERVYPTCSAEQGFATGLEFCTDICAPLGTIRKGQCRTTLGGQSADLITRQRLRRGHGAEMQQIALLQTQTIEPAIRRAIVRDALTPGQTTRLIIENIT